VLPRIVGLVTITILVGLLSSGCQSSRTEPAAVATPMARAPSAPTLAAAPPTATAARVDQPSSATAAAAPAATRPAALHPTSQAASTTTTSQVAPTATPHGAAPRATPTGAAVSASRTTLLKTANTAYAGKALSQAETLYGRVINAPPGAAESPSQTRALTDFAEFRLLLTLVSMGSDARGQQLVQRLRSTNADSPFTRLASDFWDQYGMTASLPAACASITPEVSSQATAALGELQRLGVASSARDVCTAPGT